MELAANCTEDVAEELDDKQMLFNATNRSWVLQAELQRRSDTDDRTDDQLRVELLVSRILEDASDHTPAKQGCACDESDDCEHYHLWKTYWGCDIDTSLISKKLGVAIVTFNKEKDWWVLHAPQNSLGAPCIRGQCVEGSVTWRRREKVDQGRKWMTYTLRAVHMEQIAELGTHLKAWVIEDTPQHFNAFKPATEGQRFVVTVREG